MTVGNTVTPFSQRIDISDNTAVQGVSEQRQTIFGVVNGTFPLRTMMKVLGGRLVRAKEMEKHRRGWMEGVYLPHARQNIIADRTTAVYTVLCMMVDCIDHREWILTQCFGFIRGQEITLITRRVVTPGSSKLLGIIPLQDLRQRFVFKCNDRKMGEA